MLVSFNAFPFLIETTVHQSLKAFNPCQTPVERRVGWHALTRIDLTNLGFTSQITLFQSESGVHLLSPLHGKHEPNRILCDNHSSNLLTFATAVAETKAGTFLCNLQKVTTVLHMMMHYFATKVNISPLVMPETGWPKIKQQGGKKLVNTRQFLWFVHSSKMFYYTPSKLLPVWAYLAGSAMTEQTGSEVLWVQSSPSSQGNWNSY